MNADRALKILARPGALRWFIVIAATVWLFGFDNIADRLGFPRGECPVEVLQLRSE